MTHRGERTRLMSESLLRVTDFVRRRGLAEIPRRIKQELATPTTPLGRRIYPAVIAAWGLRRRLSSIRGRNAGAGLIAFYDLGHWPITFDFLWFLLAAEIARQEAGLPFIHLVLVPPTSWEEGPEEAAYYKVVNGDARRQRLYDILIPACQFLPSITGLTLAESREAASLLANRRPGEKYPHSYFPETPAQFVPFSRVVVDRSRRGGNIPSLRPTAAALAWADAWSQTHMAGRPFVTVTIRDYGYNILRNSNVAAWNSFARELKERGLSVVFIPDMLRSLDATDNPFSDALFLPEAAWNLGFRAAIYERAYVNCGVNGGPMSLCIFNPISRYILFRMVVESDPVGNSEYQRQLGFDPGKPFPFASPFQRIVAEPDELETIRAEFTALQTLIEGSGEI